MSASGFEIVGMFLDMIAHFCSNESDHLGSNLWMLEPSSASKIQHSDVQLG